MDEDLWENMESDPDAIARIKKAVALLDAKEGMTVLDVGCHKQEAFQYLPDGTKYYGVNDTVLVPNTIRLNIDGGFEFPLKVDRILCLEVLEHLECPYGTLQSLSNVLKDDGVLVVSLPNEATLFHRLRCLFGTVDQECFNFPGKHLHLPSFKQCRKFLSEQFEISRVHVYIASKPRGTRQKYLSSLLSRIPSRILVLLATLSFSLFARGFIFKLRKRLP